MLPVKWVICYLSIWNRIPSDFFLDPVFFLELKECTPSTNDDTDVDKYKNYDKQSVL
jgi:hypothetical protein